MLAVPTTLSMGDTAISSASTTRGPFYKVGQLKNWDASAIH
jgi:hypothetical protein